MSEVAQLESGSDIVPADPGAVEAHVEHGHPEPRQYVMIAVVLVVITALEVAASYLDVNSTLLIAMLFVMAIVKFVLVVSWYMHLKTDKPILRRFFLVGLIGAPILYLVITLALNALINDYNTPVTGP